jgi:hypothetical protein
LFERSVERKARRMANPWMKKNPFLSMWLSGVNAMLGKARNEAIAQAARNQATFTKEAARAVAKAGTPSAPNRRRRK